jgi:hypothetical protein
LRKFLRSEQEQLIKQKDDQLKREKELERNADLARLQRINANMQQDSDNKALQRQLFQQEQMKLMDYR